MYLVNSFPAICCGRKIAHVMDMLHEPQKRCTKCGQYPAQSQLTSLSMNQIFPISLIHDELNLREVTAEIEGRWYKGKFVNQDVYERTYSHASDTPVPIPRFTPHTCYASSVCE